ncbi:hypothetical protein K458DRAFT_423425 [Lentithecium fluviatile CBS 122367]|uniref:Uncharacterized protein n=1 Tax=Lentithecium fluviatile CBS 122367 TaxID=1168545 RepID=A0A6G1IIT9_9PLEO|nr:hypothetical protein K458DRAFT_423425 [Lentithecium fluviatile CBS 122367]
MKFTLPLVLLSALSSVYAAVPVPKGTGAAIIDIPNWSELRIYHQDGSSTGIKEITTKLPTTGVLNDGFVFTGATRANTPLAAISWSSGKDDPEIRVYFITPSNTLGEVAYIAGTGWNGGGNIGFPVQAGAEALYAKKVDNYLLVGYTNAAGNLAEAYYDLNNPGWKTYNF